MKQKIFIRRDYWDKNRVEELPEKLRHIFFDMCVNQGRGTAVKILQRACNAKGAEFAIDGGFGPAQKVQLKHTNLPQKEFVVID